MSKLAILEAKVAELERRLNDQSQVSLSESQLTDLFFRIESCNDFNSLQDLSIFIGKLNISKYESLVFALAARIRQNSLTTEKLDTALDCVIKELAMLEKQGTVH